MKAYEVSQKDPATTTGRKSVVLMRKLGIAEETCPSSVRGLYRLPKIHKKNLLSRHTVWYIR